MRLTILLLSALLCANFAFAQPHKTISAKHKAALTRLLSANPQAKRAHKSTSVITGERVIAQSTYNYFSIITTDSLTDSVSLVYNRPTRGSAYDYNMMFYSYSYPYATTPMFNYAGTFTKPQVLYDTFRHWTLDPTTITFGFYEETDCTYDSASNDLVKCNQNYADTITNINMSYADTFNAANNIQVGYWFTRSAGITDSADKQFFSYDTTGKLTEDSIYQYSGSLWVLGAKSYYQYDTTGNLTQIDCYANFGGSFIEQLQYINTYDTGHKLLTVLTSEFDGTALTQYVKDTFAYTAGIGYHTSWKEYVYDGINHYWAPIGYMTKHIDTSMGYPDSVSIQAWDSTANNWVAQTIDVISYDTANQPVKISDYEFNGSSFSSIPAVVTNYYYEVYHDTLPNPTNVATVAQQQDAIIVYPNPASNTLIIEQGIVQHTAAYIQLFNTTGQCILRNTYPQGNASTEVPIGSLASGMYWLAVYDGGGNIIHRQTVVKQ